MATIALGRRGALVLSWRARAGRGTLAAGVALAFGVVFALNLLGLLAPPHLSLLLDASPAGTTRVAWVLPRSTLWERGVRAGVPVLALDGRPPRAGVAGTWAGVRVAVRARDGRALLVDARDIRRDSTWPLLLLSPWFLLLGTLVVLRTLRRVAGRAAYALFAGVAFMLALAPGADGDELLPRAGEIVAVALVSISFVRFFLIFPRALGTPRLRARARACPALPGPGPRRTAVAGPRGGQ